MEHNEKVSRVSTRRPTQRALARTAALSSRSAKWEPPALAIRQSDGSLVLERNPDPAVKAPAEIPRGVKLEHVVKVEVQPRPTSNAKVSLGSGIADPCLPTEIDLSLLRNPDTTQRIVASSPDGRIICGLDIPTTPIPEKHKVPHWSVSALRGYDMTRGRLDWGMEANYWRGSLVVTGGVVGATTFIGVGLRF